MTQPIESVQLPHIEHGVLIDLVIPTQVNFVSATVSGTIVTATFTAPGFEPFEDGTTITVSGVSPAGYNGTFTVISATATQVQYQTTAAPGVYVSGGVARGVDRRFYISNCYKNIVFQGRTYQALGGFLEISNLQQDLILTNNEIAVGLSGIPAEFIENILGQQIKGGRIRIHRVFFDPQTKAVRINSTGAQEIYQRFDGVMTNFSVQEQINQSENSVDISYVITVQASSLLGVLENRVSGRRTNNDSYQTFYNERGITSAIETDTSFSRIEQLKNASFDFGRPPK